MNLDTIDGPLADEDVPVLGELPFVPSTAMPALQVQTRYHALLREVGRDGEKRAGAGAGSGAGLLRRRALRWKVALPGLALGVLAVTLALSYGGNGAAGAGPGLDDSALAASWTPVATVPSAAQVQDAKQRCTTLPAQVVVAEQRGQVTAMVLTSGTTREACVVGGGQQLSVELWSAASPADFGSRVVAMGKYHAAFEAGQVAPDVATARVTLSDGKVVTATVKDGWAFVWWPGSAAAQTVTEYAADGSVVKTVSTR